MVDAQTIRRLERAGHEVDDQLQTALLGMASIGYDGESIPSPFTLLCGARELRNLLQREQRHKRQRRRYRHDKWRRMRTPNGTKAPVM